MRHGFDEDVIAAVARPKITTLPSARTTSERENYIEALRKGLDSGFVRDRWFVEIARQWANAIGEPWIE